MSQKPRAGDRISVTIEGIVTNPYHGESYIALKGGNPDNPRENIYIGLSTDAARTIKILSRDLKVGDEVYAVAINGNRYTNNAIIAAIAEGQALLKWTGGGGFGNYPLSKLKLAEEGCDC